MKRQGEAISFRTPVRGTMRLTVSLLCLLSLGLLAACDHSPGVADIPAQHFTSTLNLLGRGEGSVAGQIVFPSEYTQRSATFSLDRVKFATEPDGRFLVRTVPAGQHTLGVYLPGFDPIERTLEVRNKELANVQRLALQPAWGKVLGRVVGPDGASAAGLQVLLQPYGIASTTDRDGIFQFLGVGAGDHVVAVNAPGFLPLQRPLHLASNEVRNLGILPVQRVLQPAAQTAAQTAALQRGG
ncbi:MAG TPA: carboxypeptidase regulatory-like domain-containing protein [bacterium]|nr:carboxypeptidase regulatory-like domain-containing protein [bacterium]